ncbi:MAG: hypothetical protein KY429_01995 [Actinobacteria bacterium]|nr:hypothetical protein [Actinomycetota bacterium]
MKRWKRRLLVLGSTALILLTAVSCSLRSRNQSPLEIIHTTLPERLQTETVVGGSAQQAPPAGDGILALTVRDQSGSGPEGIPVSIDGPIQEVKTTDSGGRVTMDLPPGFYSVGVLDGCTERLQVLSGGSAQLAIAPGETTEGELRTEWRHRFAPSGPVHSSVTPYWPVGKEVSLRYNVVDRCRDELREPNGSIPTFRFHHNEVLSILGSPQMIGDGDGYGHLSIRCTREGAPTLMLVDELNPTDVLDLPKSDTSSGTPPECRHT